MRLKVIPRCVCQVSLGRICSYMKLLPYTGQIMHINWASLSWKSKIWNVTKSKPFKVADPLFKSYRLEHFRLKFQIQDVNLVKSMQIFQIQNPQTWNTSDPSISDKVYSTSSMSFQSLCPTVGHSKYQTGVFKHRRIPAEALRQSNVSGLGENTKNRRPYNTKGKVKEERFCRAQSFGFVQNAQQDPTSLSLQRVPRWSLRPCTHKRQSFHTNPTGAG